MSAFTLNFFFTQSEKEKKTTMIKKISEHSRKDFSRNKLENVLD